MTLNDLDESSLTRPMHVNENQLFAISLNYDFLFVLSNKCTAYILLLIEFDEYSIIVWQLRIIENMLLSKTNFVKSNMVMSLQ